MKIGGMMLARNEQHEIGLSARVALQWCDFLVIYVHASGLRMNDQLIRLLDEYGSDRVVCAKNTDLDWNEMIHRGAALKEARMRGATHLAIIDADEILTANILPSIRDTFARLAPDQLLDLPGYNLRNGLTHYHSNGVWGNRRFTLGFMNRPDIGWFGNRFHARAPHYEDGRPAFNESQMILWKGGGREGGGIMHLWGANERRLKAKHAWYKMTERIRFPHKPVSVIDFDYSQSIKGRNDQDCPATWKYAEVPASWWSGYEDWMARYLTLDVEPWQEAECVAMLEAHGRDKFAGLDLFGVV